MNTIYGWGKEDDALINRLGNIGVDKVLYPKIGKVIDLEGLNIEEKLKTVSNKKDMIAYEKLCEDLKSWNTNGLNSLNYKVLLETDIMENIVQIKVDLLKHDDEKKYPHLFKPEFDHKNIFNRIYREVKDKLKAMKYEII